MQLIPIPARDTKQDDFLFSTKIRKLCRVEYIVPMDSTGRTIDLATEGHLLAYVSVSFHGVYAEEYKADDTVLLAVDVEGLGVLG